MAVRRLPNDNLGHEENELIFGGIIGKFDEFDGGFDVFGEPTFTFGIVTEARAFESVFDRIGTVNFIAGSGPAHDGFGLIDMLTAPEFLAEGG